MFVAADQSVRWAQKIDTLSVNQYYSQARNPIFASLLSYLINGSGHIYANNWRDGCTFVVMETALAVLFFKEFINRDNEPGNNSNRETLLVNSAALTYIGLRVLEIFDVNNKIGKYNSELALRIFGKPIELKYNYLIVINNKVVH